MHGEGMAYRTKSGWKAFKCGTAFFVCRQLFFTRVRLQRGFAAKKINTKLCKLPANATDLVQPADSFVIQRIKEAWRRRCDDYKLSCVKNGIWKDGVESEGNGKLLNPGKKYSPNIASESVKEVIIMVDRNRFSTQGRKWL